MGNFEGIALFVEETDNRLIAALHCKGITDVAVKGFCRPEVTICLSRVVDEFGKLQSPFLPYDVWPARPLIDDQSVNPFIVKQVNLGAKAPFTHLQGRAYLFAGNAYDQHLYRIAPYVGLKGSHLPGFLQSLKRGILRIRYGKGWSHTKNMA